jgi:hypothetical protein
MNDGTAPTWVVLADEGRARILAWHAPGTDLEDVEELTDAAARADNADLRRDAFGRRASGGTGLAGNVTASAGEDLAQAHQRHRFERLRIVAAPRFLGRLRKQLDAQVKEAVIDEIDKNLLQLDRRTLTERLFPPGPHAKA